MSKPVLIIEKNTTNIASTTPEVKKKNYIMEGEFTRFNTRNRNDRIYTPENFLPHVQDLLERKKELGVIYGEYDHPTVFDTQLQRVSHVINDLRYIKEKNIVYGELKLLSNYWGKEARSLVDDGLPIFVSSRCAGKTDDNGVVEVMKLITYDIVGDPGFSSTKMNLKCLNESFNYSENVNFRIYDLTKESNFNNLLMDKKNNEFVTKEEIREYSKYLASEIVSVKKQIKEAIKYGDDSKKINELLNYQENIMEAIDKIGEYLDYLSGKVKKSLQKYEKIEEKTKSLEFKNELIVDHIDYIAENVENTIEYAEHIAKHTKKASEEIKNVIAFAEHIAENVKYDRNKINGAINDMRQINEKMQNTIEFAEHIARGASSTQEWVKNIIKYQDYSANKINRFYDETTDNFEKINKKTDVIQENLNNTIKYAEYNANYINKTINFTEEIAEKIKKSGVINEGFKNNSIPSFEEFEKRYDKEMPFTPSSIIKEGNVYTFENPNDYPILEDDDTYDEIIKENVDGSSGGGMGQNSSSANNNNTNTPSGNTPAASSTNEENGNNGKINIGAFVKIKMSGRIGKVINLIEKDGNVVSAEVEVDGVKRTYNIDEFDVVNETTENLRITESINKLIKEIKKRDEANNQEPNFFNFLNQKQKAEFRALSPEQREKVLLAFRENKTYTSTRDVLNIIAEALNENKPTFKDILISNMPADIEPVWESLNDSEKNLILEQAEWYDLSNKTLIESFWRTRNYPKKDESTIILESSNLNRQDDYIDSETRKRFLEVFQRYS